MRAPYGHRLVRSSRFAVRLRLGDGAAGDDGAIEPGTPPSIDAGVVLRNRYRSRLPATERPGPSLQRHSRPAAARGPVGAQQFSPGPVQARMSLYRTVLAEGQCEDVVSFPNRGLLIAQWPVLRRLISRFVRGVWEETFPELAGSRGVGVGVCGSVRVRHGCGGVAGERRISCPVPGGCVPSLGGPP